MTISTLDTPAPKTKAPTLPQRMDAMEQGYGILFAHYDCIGREVWHVGPVVTDEESEDFGQFAKTPYNVTTWPGQCPEFCNCRSSETPCKHRRFVFRHLNQEAQRGPCPDCEAQQRGGVMFVSRVDVDGPGAAGSLYYHVCDVCSKRRGPV